MGQKSEGAKGMPSALPGVPGRQGRGALAGRRHPCDRKRVAVEGWSKTQREKGVGGKGGPDIEKGKEEGESKTK